MRELVRAAFDTTEPGHVIEGLTEDDMKNFTAVEDEVHKVLTSKARMLEIGRAHV